MSGENNKKRLALWKTAYIVIAALLILSADFLAIRHTVISHTPKPLDNGEEYVISDYELFESEELAEVLNDPEIGNSGSNYEIEQGSGTITGISVGTITSVNGDDRHDYSYLVLKIQSKGKSQYYELYEQTEVVFNNADEDKGILKIGDTVSYDYFDPKHDCTLVSIKVERNNEVTADLKAEYEKAVRTEQIEAVTEKLPCMVIPNLFAVLAAGGLYFCINMAVSVFGQKHLDNNSNRPIVTKGKYYFAWIVIAITIIVDILLFCIFELPILVSFVTKSYNSDYDSFPEYTGVVEEIIAHGSEPYHYDPNETYAVVDVISVKLSLSDSDDSSDNYIKIYEDSSVDSVVVGSSYSYVSPKVAKIKVSGPDGERWFKADRDTYVYGAVSNYQGLAVIEKGQSVAFAYGPKDGVDDYDYIYAVKGKTPVQSYIRSLAFFAIIVTITGILGASSIIVLMLALTHAFAENIKVFNGVIVIAFITILMLIVWYGVDSYIRAANKAASSITSHAPIIYLYTESDEPVNVQLELDGELTVTYPEYVPDEGWTVTASPDGTLTDSDGNTYPFLFWEGDLNMDYDLSHGYCVKGSDTEAFLDSTLAELGLTENEAADFKAYWLPQMEGNAYNVITFQTTAFDDAVSHSVTPEPDTVIRVNMLWYASETEVEIEPQDLAGMNPMPEDRDGFVFVEWGGEVIDACG